MELTAMAAAAADCAGAVSETRWGLTLVLATIVVVGGVAIVILALGSLVRAGALLAIPVVIAALLAVQLHTRSGPADCSPAIPPLPAGAAEQAPQASGPPTSTTTVPASPQQSPGTGQLAPPAAVPSAPRPAAVETDAVPATDATTETTLSGPSVPQVPAAMVATAAEPVADTVVVTLRSPPGGALVSVDYLTWVDGDSDGAAAVWRSVGTVNGATIVLANDSAGNAWRPGTTYWVQVRARYPSGPGPVSDPLAVQVPGVPDVAGAEPVGSASPVT